MKYLPESLDVYPFQVNLMNFCPTFDTLTFSYIYLASN